MVKTLEYTNNIKLSKSGQIIDRQWNDLSDQYDNVELEESIIMPNYIYGIIVINNPVETGHCPY